MFKEGPFSVSREWVRTGLHDVRTRDVAAISMGRAAWAVIPLAVGAAGVVLAVKTILLPHEIAGAMTLCALAAALSWRVGWMRLKGDALRGEPMRIVGEWGRLQRLRTAIRKAQAEHPDEGGA